MTEVTPSGAVQRSVRWVLGRHLLSLVLVIGAVVGVAAIVADRIASDAATEHAEVDTRTLAAKYVRPLTVSDLQRGDAAAREALDQAFAVRLEHDELRRIKIWEPAGGSEGTIIYSDRDELVGRTYDLGESATLFGTDGDALAHRLTPEEYPQDGYPDGTYEAYVGFLDSTGSPYIFEAYFPTPQMAVSRGELLRDWLPLLVGALVLLGAATIPLSVRLARRAVAADAERRVLWARALDAGAAERRRLAQRLHDGVVQDLSGAGLALDSVEGLDASQRAVVDQVAAILRGDVRQLRSMGEEMFGDAPVGDLEAVLRTVVDESGLPRVTLDVDGSPALVAPALVVVRDVVREALRNVATHAGPAAVVVTATVVAGELRVEVADDGRGFDGPAEPGHLGLRLVAAAARDAGGRVEVDGTPGAGTRLLLVLPA